MSEISRTALFGKLNSLAYKAIEGATVFCKMRGNPYVELEHWFAQLLQAQDSDLHRVIQHYGLDVSVIAKDMTTALDRLPRGATAISDFSPHIENAIERAWTYATLQFGEAQVRTGYLLVGMLKTQSLRNPLFGLSKQFEKVKVEDLADNFAKICDASPEAQMRAQDGTGMGSGAPGEDSGAMAPAAMGKGDALKKFAVDLTEKAKKGEMDPVTGRDEEIRQIVDILMRRRQNNPLLTGEAGVGKTAVVEGFAQRLARGDVPPQLKDVKLLTLDIGLLQAGASMKGEFEQRLRQVIDEVQSSPTPIILFIDEIHTLVGAGGAAGTGDAANLLKPALARGNLRTIGATTWAEYKKYIEKDPALTRRFQVVQVPEPDETKAILMLRGVASVLEKHHRVQLLDEAIEAAVKLSHRYIPARQLPDKAVSLLDTACARVAVSQHATPPEVEDCMRRIEGLTVEQEIIGREEAIGIDVTKRAAQVAALLAESKVQLDALNARWQEEKGLVDRLLELRSKLRAGNKPVDTPAAATATDAAAPASAEPAPDRAALLAELHELQAKIHAVQGESPLILPSVDEQAVASVVADWTGIPVGRMVKNEVEAVLKLADTLNQRVIGQKHGLEMIARRIQTSRARLDNPQKPIGVFMLCGTSGVGKTETALALAEALYGGEQNIITINMSEFQEAHTVSTLKGAPPGYVGYGEGGILTEAVRRRPYSVVLLDEVEKAHPDVHEIFFQVFDKGWMEDGEGRMIDFKNTIILLTTNAGSELVMSMCRDPELLPEPNSLADALKAPLMKVFPPALLGRIVTIPYYPLSPEMMKKIVRLQLGRIKKRVETNHGVPFEYSDAVVDQVVARCQDPESGGRVIDAILTNTVLPTISVEYLQRLASGGEIRRVALDVKDADFTYAFD
ncbi:type VI secretion system ATPase TssH [Variovorax sp. NFACC27]|uniref:type VI secretion system ATPase TssH n=1 Tax=unclassified Variovorax TaxID=663243 RepID=UPI0008995060|nr:type VI secretion system ATPase TssH [Variovorax sp. YR750]SEF26200.1 type VI secretion system protein VasG [Variovorax sp. NFACC28]SEG53572.1 type VI secretion system protein VasG [Variovorax sp. NFACC29]SFC15736.1 type VI secretion system protein VasG [Variovorax sp. NFACC26]SFH10509.1 type VI secretion system protein VasG [Variovorax sp. NFACC27]SEL81072.1 type VI secretion system protein VasG [Variovorax sp. YR750]